MTELQRYLAEEVAEDHADGIITRREAMRRVGLLGVSGALATSRPSPRSSRIFRLRKFRFHSTEICG